ncbi:MAG TPA: PBP1A family penicillin-binding protein, partial [Thermoanaerobaculia bacterium]|nr:PBP1A family penicillin-binding protein [Thermoanaerobaculia bacterium]
MVDFAPRLTRRRVVQTVAVTSIVLAAVVIALVGYVYFQSIKTFEIRRVSLPTRIFTDMLPLAGGAPISSDLLHEKLDRLGYRSNSSLQVAGDYSDGKGSVDVFLRAFRHPTGDRTAQKIRVTFNRSGIDSVAADGGSTTGVALEPELLTSVLGDQLENRRPVTLDQVPPQLVDAVVSTEDTRFFQHPGVDPIGIMRALMANIARHGVSEGGSTLTQQLVKNYYLTSERTMRRKVVEAFMSVILDAKYSKREILEAYLNDIYLGRNRSISILGVGEAANFYFSKPVSELNVAEAALIAGMIRGPNNYSPFEHPDKALARRTTVLGLMLKNRKIDEKQYQDAMRTPLPAKPNRSRSEVSSIPFYVDRVLQELKDDYGIKDVKGRGLSIYTAIDLDAQDLASQGLVNSLAGLEKANRKLRRDDNPLQGVMIEVDVPTGEIRALVGGRNYDQSQFNRALYSKRQVGSLFKPFVYLTAFEPSLSGQNVTPATLVNDSRFVYKPKFGKEWSPHNYEDAYHGVVTVRQALEQSMNAASVRIGLAAGVDNIIKTAHVLGVDTEIENVPSSILGSVGIPPVEMAEAYTTIARIGSRVPLHAVRYVTNDRGTAVSTEEVKATQVFPARDVYLIVRVMEGVLQRGTAAGAKNYGFTKIAAGKTGTTNDKRDAWFIGFTPQKLALTWLGFDDNAPIGISGAEGAVPI